MLLAADELLHGELGMRRYGARGAVKAMAKLVNNWIVVELNMREGWHINAHQPLQKNLIGTRLDGEQLGQVFYPKPDYLRLSFQRSTLALYQGKVRLHGKLLSQMPGALSVRLQFQACDDKRCLPPEEMVFKVR
ncbi:hypothetical protein THIOM_001404 [Candidatus Thiomargarita nelsonii]|uniref:Thiol:disulfide interchange protein DsbD N-terminal domain-containing protein n=1 Tax=Candidatus Thiomargarita nelsonii TaxID=1003181 RepID=A0A176S3Z0_9GAMM|nr:hypothetical protein THIOM_001404 [Candidatus Thiomargarita nelsonii]